jgi:hypothetical protein
MIDKTFVPSELPKARDHGESWRTRMPVWKQTMTLANAPQDSPLWAKQRQLSNGSSSAGAPSGNAYSDIFHLMCEMKQGKHPPEDHDRQTLDNFARGHYREPQIRDATDIVSGGWFGESGMHLHLDAWRHHPGYAKIMMMGGDETDSDSDSDSDDDDEMIPLPIKIVKLPRRDRAKHTRGKRIKPRDPKKKRNSEEGRCVCGAYPGCIACYGSDSESDSEFEWSDDPPEIKEEEAIRKDRRPHIQKRRKLTGAQAWAKARSSDAWPEGMKHTSPDGLAYFPPGVFHTKYELELFLAGKIGRKGLLEIKAPGFGPMRSRGRAFKSDRKAKTPWQEKPVHVPHKVPPYYAFQVQDQMEVMSSWPAGKADFKWCMFVPMWTAVPPKPFVYVVEKIPRWFQNKFPSDTEAAKIIYDCFFIDKNPPPNTPPTKQTKVWVTGHLHWSLVLRDDVFIKAAYQHFYEFYNIITKHKKAPKKFHLEMKDEHGKIIKLTTIPTKTIVWSVHTTPETPPVPSYYALDKYGLDPKPHEVQSVTRKMTIHDTDSVASPPGWPSDKNWPLDAFITVFVVHDWDAKPMRQTLKELKTL